MPKRLKHPRTGNQEERGSYRNALVTGASSGLGEEFAWQLASSVECLILVARRKNRLDELASAIRLKFPQTQVVVIVSDLVRLESRESLVRQVAESGLQPDLLIHNAGLGDYGEFSTSEWSKVEAQLRVNIEALTHLTHAWLPKMVAARHGAILNVSSLASLLPIPDFAVYAASKAYVTSFTEALRLELRESGIVVAAVCPGPVKTGFGDVARRSSQASSGGGFRSLFYINRAQVVSEALEMLGKRRPRCYPGWRIRLAAAWIGCMPTWLIRKLMATRPRR